jgi:uncharacterized protein (TIGR02996 family)
MPRAQKLDAASPYPPGWEPFLAAINADLDDDTPRLVFADWLQENGDEPRAQFIRLQCAAARDGTTSEALLAEHRARWVMGLPKMCRERPERIAFRRGFVAGLVVRGRDWASTTVYGKDADVNGRAIRRVTALEELHIEQLWSTVLEVDSLAGMRGLTLAAAGSGIFESLPNSPALPSLTGLAIKALSSNGTSQRSLRAGLGATKLSGLRRLRIESLLMGDLIAECLEAPHFAGLEELRLRHLAMTTAGVETLARAPFLGNLRVLDLCNNRLGTDGLALLLANPALRKLEELVLQRCDLTSASAQALAAWDGLRTVRKLNLLDNRLRRADAELIAASPHAVNLTDFEVPLRS